MLGSSSSSSSASAGRGHSHPRLLCACARSPLACLFTWLAASAAAAAAFLLGCLSVCLQIYTQHAYKRSFAVVLMLGAVDDEKGPQLFRVDPAGHFLGYKASAAGVKEQEAVNLLEKHFKSDAGAAGAMSADETIRAAITTMQGILTSDFKAAEIEMSIVSGRW